MLPHLALYLALFLGWAALLNTRSQDAAGAPSQQGRSQVTDVVYASGGSVFRPVYLELDHRTVNLTGSAASVIWLEKGQRVRYTYRVGRSGAWFVDQISQERGRP